jgi:hypothetical protein
MYVAFGCLTKYSFDRDHQKPTFRYTAQVAAKLHLTWNEGLVPTIM